MTEAKVEKVEKDPTGRFWGEIVLFGGVAGAVAALIKLLVHHAFVWTRLAKPFYSALNAYLIHGHYHVKGLMEAVFGELGDMAIGAFFGIVLTFLLRHSRQRYHWPLGAFFGLGVWYFSLFFGNLTKIIKADETTEWSLFAHLIAMIVFGLFIVLASRIWKPLRERVF